MSKLHALYNEALEADARFTSALRRQFGAQAGDRRYDRRKTGWDSETVRLCDEFLAATNDFLAACRGKGGAC